MTFRLLISGSRHWTDEATIAVILQQYLNEEDVVLVSGACPRGADRICEEFAAEVGWKVELHPADWDTYGTRAGFVRNADMVKLGADACVAFIKNQSKGATMLVDLARTAGMRVRIFRSDERRYAE